MREHADIDVATRSAARRRQDKAGKPSKSRRKSVEDREARAEKEEEYDHGTDDSDWESSSDEDGSDLGRIKEKFSSSKKRSTKVCDDGDRTSYVNRLEEWHAARTNDDLKLDSKYELLEGGLRSGRFLDFFCFHFL